jgi:hypothetical protein
MVGQDKAVLNMQLPLIPILSKAWNKSYPQIRSTVSNEFITNVQT